MTVRGLKQGLYLRFTTNDADLAIYPGSLHIASGTITTRAIGCNEIVYVPLPIALHSYNGWLYVYARLPFSGLIFNSSDFSFDINPPIFDSSNGKLGWYRDNYRCIGAVYPQSEQDAPSVVIKPMLMSSDRAQFLINPLLKASGTINTDNGGDKYIVLNVDLPKFADFGIFEFCFDRLNAPLYDGLDIASEIEIRYSGSDKAPQDGKLLAKLDTSNTRAVQYCTMPVFFNDELTELRCSIAGRGIENVSPSGTFNDFAFDYYMYIDGYLLPPFIADTPVNSLRSTDA